MELTPTTITPTHNRPVQVHTHTPRQPIHSEALITIEDLTVAYNSQPAIAGVSMHIKTGAVTALIGPSGCGKTSLLTSINRLTDLIPGCTVTGRLAINDTEVLNASTDVTTLRRRVGMIFQKPNPFPVSIRKNLTWPLRGRGITRRSSLQEITESALKRVGLWDEVKDRLDRSALDLSGGQQQRLCLARAIALEPEVLLLDEPCNALDPISTGIVEDLIHTLRGQYTVVAVTHNLAQARRIADDVAVFWAGDQSGRGVGRLVEFGNCAQVFDQPADPITSAYIRCERC